MLQVMPRGPAAKAGILKGDVLTHIDSVGTKGLTAVQRLDRILGCESCTITIMALQTWQYRYYPAVTVVVTRL